MHVRRRFWILAIPCALIGVLLVDAARGATAGTLAALVAVVYLVVVFTVSRRLRRRGSDGTIDPS